MLSLGNLPLDLTAETGSVSEASVQQQQEQGGQPEQIQQAAALDATLERAVHPPTALASLPPTVAHLVLRHWQLKVCHWQLKAVATYDDDV